MVVKCERGESGGEMWGGGESGGEMWGGGESGGEMWGGGGSGGEMWGGEEVVNVGREWKWW